MASSGCRSSFAALICILYYLDLNPNLTVACDILNKSLEKYPSCVLYHWVASIVSWKCSQVDDAVFYIKKALWSCGEELSPTAAFLKYELGWFYFLKLQWPEALIQFEGILYDCLSLSTELDSFVK